MNLPTRIVGRRKIDAQIADLNAKVRSLRPLRSVGTLTGHTSVGVTRRAASDFSAPDKAPTAARWG